MHLPTTRIVRPALRAVFQLMLLALGTLALAQAAPALIPTGLPNERLSGSNAAGQFYGTSDDRPYFGDPDTGVQLLPPMGEGFLAFVGMNRQGLIAGQYLTSDWVQHGFVWSPSTGFHDYGRPGEVCQLIAISDSGAVLGYTYDNITRRLVIWDGATSGAQPRDLDLFPGADIQVREVNNRGAFMGVATWEDGFQSFYWDAATGVQSLPSMGPDARFCHSGRIFFGVGNSGQLLVWDPVRGVLNVPSPVAGLDRRATRGEGELADGRLVVAGGAAGAPVVILIDPRTGTAQALAGPDGAVAGVEFFAMSSRCVVGQYAGGRTFIWDSARGAREIVNPAGTPFYVWAVSELGQATGVIDTVAGRRALFWNEVAGFQNLGTLPGGSYSEGFSISERAIVGFGDSATASNSVFYARLAPFSASDTQAPTISSLSASPNTITPPNKKMIPVTLTAAATDNVGVTALHIVSVASSEIVNGTFSQVTGNLTLKLLADRNGNGSGRIYTITVEATDAAGNRSTRNVTVTVPHDQRN